MPASRMGPGRWSSVGIGYCPKGLTLLAREDGAVARAPEIIIVVDTTATFDDVMLSRTRWMQLLSLCARKRVRVAIPIVVLLERARHWEEQATDAVKAAKGRYGRAVKGRKSFSDLGLGELADPIPVPHVPIDRGVAHEELVERLTKLGVEILPLPTVTVPEILERDLAGKRPFDKSGKGFRDALIWHSVKELLAQLKSDCIVYFVTNNTGDFCLGDDLHPDLQSEIGGLGLDLRRVGKLDELVETDPISPLIAGLAATDEELEAFLTTAMEAEAEDFPTPSIGDLIREALESAVSALIDEEIQTDADEMRFGLDFSEIAIPREIDSPTIVHVEPDPKSVEWDTYETYDEETLLIRASIDAEVEVQGFVYKSDYYGMEDEVTLIQFDWNDHMSFVQASVEARLVFQLRVEAGAGVVEQAEFEMAESLIAEV